MAKSHQTGESHHTETGADVVLSPRWLLGSAFNNQNCSSGLVLVSASFYIPLHNKDNWHLLSVYYLPGTLLWALHTLIHFCNPQENFILTLFYNFTIYLHYSNFRLGNLVIGRLNKLLKVIACKWLPLPCSLTSGPILPTPVQELWLYTIHFMIKVVF